MSQPNVRGVLRDGEMPFAHKSHTLVDVSDERRTSVFLSKTERQEHDTRTKHQRRYSILQVFLRKDKQGGMKEVSIMSRWRRESDPFWLMHFSHSLTFAILAKSPRLIHPSTSFPSSHVPFERLNGKQGNSFSTDIRFSSLLSLLLFLWQTFLHGSIFVIFVALRFLYFAFSEFRFWLQLLFYLLQKCSAGEEFRSTFTMTSCREQSEKMRVGRDDVTHKTSGNSVVEAWISWRKTLLVNKKFPLKFERKIPNKIILTRGLDFYYGRGSFELVVFSLLISFCMRIWLLLVFSSSDIVSFIIPAYIYLLSPRCPFLISHSP